MNKKIFLVFIVLLLIFSMTISASAALGWGDISDLSLWTQEAPVPLDAFYYNDIPTDRKLNMFKQPYTMYVSLYMGVGPTNQTGYDSITDDSMLGDLNDIPYTTITNSPYAQENIYRDVTTLVSFGNSANNSLKPVQVFVGEVASAGTMLDVVPLDGYLNKKTWSTYESQFPGQYEIKNTRYRERVEFVLKYQIDPTFVTSNNSATSFYDYTQYIDLTPYFNNYPYNVYLETAQVSINVRAIFTVLNKTIKCVYTGENTQPYRVITSTNAFTMSDSVINLQLPWREGTLFWKKYVPIENFVYKQEYMFSDSHQQRYGITKNFQNLPYYNVPITEKVQGMHYEIGFSFGDKDASLYAVGFRGAGMKYGVTSIDDNFQPIGDITGSYYAGYRYNVNSTSNCAYLRFGVDVFISFKQDYLFSIIEQENNITGDIDISQFYKSTDFNIEPPEDITDIFRPIVDFFKQLFVIVLPNIINNFVVWFMCESPMISTITRPIFLMAYLTYGYVVSWIVPVITSLGIFGGIFFVIFMIKRLIPHLLGGKE